MVELVTIIKLWGGGCMLGFNPPYTQTLYWEPKSFDKIFCLDGFPQCSTQTFLTLYESLKKSPNPRLFHNPHFPLSSFGPNPWQGRAGYSESYDKIGLGQGYCQTTKQGVFFACTK